MIDELIVSAQRSYFFAEYALYDSTSYLVGTLLQVLSCPIDRERKLKSGKVIHFSPSSKTFLSEKNLAPVSRGLAHATFYRVLQCHNV